MPEPGELPPEILAELEAAVFRCANVDARTVAIESLSAAHPEHGEAIRDWLQDVIVRDRSSSSTAPPDLPGYRPVAKLGEGGFGEVWRCEQQRPVRREVALKVLKLGMDSAAILRRFEREQEALARMSHDAIAKIHDAGLLPTGQPYFVMELVDGAPITEWCEREGLGLEARLGLFVEVCHGVQHAHQKGVVHRDLKPSNVLVTKVSGRPQPKLIDFGIARALEQGDESLQLTASGMMLGTPAYMAPEQARGDATAIDTRTDVYALGAILFQLLTGESAQGRSAACSPWELRQQIVEGETPRPSTVASQARQPSTWQRRLRGDLDWIALKAMAKEPGQRYASAAELASDIERYLRHEPVLAGAPSAGYRLRKFVRRYRSAVVGAALVLLTAVVGAAFSLRYAYDARELAVAAEAARDAEQARAASLQRVTEFQASMLKKLDLMEAGARLRASLLAAAGAREGELRELLRTMDLAAQVRRVIDQEVLAAAEKALQEQMHDDREIRVALLATLADVAASIGSLDRAERLQQAVDAERGPLAAQELGARSRDRNRSVRLLALRGRSAELVTRTRELAESAPAGSREGLLRRYDHADALAFAGRYDEAEQVFASLVEEMERTAVPDDPDLLAVLSARARLWLFMSRVEDAEVLQRRLVEAHRAALGPAHPDTLNALHNHAVMLRDLGRLAEAEPVLRELLAARIAARGTDPFLAVYTQYQLGALLSDMQRHDEAYELLADVLQRRIDAFGEGSPETEQARLRLADDRRRAGDLDAAVQLLDAALAASSEREDADGATVREARLQLAETLVERGDLEGAALLLEPAMPGGAPPADGADKEAFQWWRAMASLRGAQGRDAEAEALWRQLVDGHVRAFAAEHRDSVRLQEELARFLQSRGRAAEGASVRPESPGGGR